MIYCVWELWYLLGGVYEYIMLWCVVDTKLLGGIYEYIIIMCGENIYVDFWVILCIRNYLNVLCGGWGRGTY